MNRRLFIKRFGLGALGAAVVGKIVTQVEPEVDNIVPTDKGHSVPQSTIDHDKILGTKGWMDQIRASDRTYMYYADEEAHKRIDDMVRNLVKERYGS